MIAAARLVIPCAIAVAALGAAPVHAGGDQASHAPRDSFSSAGPPAAYGDKGFARQGAAPPMPDDRAEAYAEAQFVDGDPYGRTDYWPDGRGNRRGTQFGPGFYQQGYYYPGERQFPDYWEYDARRAHTEGSLWSVLYRGAIDPFVPDQYEMDAVRAAPLRIVTKLRIDEDLRRLHAMANRAMRRRADDAWAGGRYDQPRPMK